MYSSRGRQHRFRPCSLSARVPDVNATVPAHARCRSAHMTYVAAKIGPTSNTGFENGAHTHWCDLHLFRHRSLQRRRSTTPAGITLKGQLLSSASTTQSEPLLLAMG